MCLFAVKKRRFTSLFSGVCRFYCQSRKHEFFLSLFGYRLTVPAFLLQIGLVMGLVLSTSSAQEKASEELNSLWTRDVGKDWPDFLGLHRDSKSSEEGILKDWSGGRLKKRWVFDLSESYGIGSVAKGRFMQFDRIGDKEVLICLNAETGERIWSSGYATTYRDLYGYNGGPRTSPVIDGARVYTLGVAGQLRCCRVSDGGLVWSVDTIKKFGVVQNFFGVGSTPIIYKDKVICMVGGSPAESSSIPPGRLDLVKGNGSAVVAFDKLTGKVLYRFSNELASYSSPVIISENGVDWGFLFARGGLIGFDPSVGKQRFFYPWRDGSLESVNASNPVIVGNQVLISETYGPGSSLLSFKENGMEVVWKDAERSRIRAMQTHWNTGIHHDGFFYGSSGRHSNNAELKCVEWKTGVEKWSVPNLTRSSLLYVDGHFLCLTEAGILFLFKANPERFELVTQVRLLDKEGELLLNYPCWAAPVLSHGLLYVRGEKKLVCLDLIPVKK